MDEPVSATAQRMLDAYERIMREGFTREEALYLAAVTELHHPRLAVALPVVRGTGEPDSFRGVMRFGGVLYG